MKKIIIPVMMFNSLAIANIADLNYQPERNAFHFAHAIEYAQGGYTADVYDRKTKEMVFENHFAYGLFENISLGVKVNYLLKDEEKKEFETEKRDGLLNPHIQANYRILGEHSPILLDINADFEVSLGDRDSENAYRGGHSLSVGVDLSKKLGKLELFGLFSAKYLFESKYDDSEQTEYWTKTEYDGSLNYNATVKAQYMLSPNIFVNGGLDYLHIGEVKGDATYDDNSKTKYKYESHSDLGAFVEGRYVISDEFLSKISFRRVQTTSFKYNDFERTKLSNNQIKFGIEYGF